MKRQQNVLDESMSLHDIKDMMQLEFAKEHADFIFNNLEMLIDNTYRVAPVRRQDKPYILSRTGRNLRYSGQHHEKHWEDAIFKKWVELEDGLDPSVPFRRIVSYQVMLRDVNDNSGWGEIDLLGATAENIPVVIELKIKKREYLLRAIVEVLAYGVAIRKAWETEGCSLRMQWAGAAGKIDSLGDLPLVVVAPATYWQDVLSDSPEQIPFQTPQPARPSIKKLLNKMESVGYPLSFVEVSSEQQSEKRGLPVIINAAIKEMLI